MALVNIGEGNRDDGFYRYKMPKLVAKIEGRGNGIKTNLVNMVDVAKALARHPAYVTKYFGCVLGAQSKYEEKSATATVNGAHETPKLVQLLEGFIKKYVQCYGCGNPETEIVITKKQMITLKCAACGYLSDVDMRDKLTTFILNNPPEIKKSKASSQMRRAEKERLNAGSALDSSSKKKPSKKDGVKKSKKKEDEEPDSPPADGEIPDADEDEEDDVVWQTDTSAEAAQQRIKEQLTAAASEMVNLAIVEENAKKEKLYANGNSAKVSAPQKIEVEEKPDHADSDAEGEEDTDHLKSVADIRDFFQTHNLAETTKYLVSKGKPTVELLVAVLEALFEGVGKGLSKEVSKKKSLFAKIVPDEESQVNLLTAFEKFCGSVNVSSLKEIPKILKGLYDDDIVEEDQIVAWYGRSGGDATYAIGDSVASSVRKEALPFVQWLQEAEADEEE